MPLLERPALEADDSNSIFLCAFVLVTLSSPARHAPWVRLGVFAGFLGFLSLGLFHLVSRPWWLWRDNWIALCQEQSWQYGI